METAKVKGLKINYIISSMVIEDAYQIRGIDKMKAILDEALIRTEDFTTSRTMKSLINEWLVHNNFYRLHLFRKKHKNITFRDTQNIFSYIYYAILSFPNKIKYGISNIKKEIKTKKKIKEYKKYIEEHKANVEKAYEEIKNNTAMYQLLGQDLMNELYNRVLEHDNSKYSTEEFDAYRKNFFPINQQEKEDNKVAFDKAWKHHWRTNSHHWQYRQNKKSFDKEDNEQVLDVVENVLDWMAMGYKFNDRPYQYYENNKEHIILNEEEKKFLEYIIYKCIDVEYIDKETENGTRK